jgi:acetylornithine/N-succinyldiaminopimelate aminotransferase
MAVGNAVLDVVSGTGFLDGVNARGARLREGLDRLVAAHGTIFEEARGIGLMLGLKCRMENVKLVAALLADGLLTVPAGDNVVRLLPPLNIGNAEVDEALAILDRTAARLSAAAKETAS